jgi:hypothetical protein
MMAGPNSRHLTDKEQQKFIRTGEYETTVRVDFDERSHTAFGELSVAESTPSVNLAAGFGLRDLTDIETFTGDDLATPTGGTANVELGSNGYEYRCRTETGIGGYGVIRSRRSVIYRPGQGTIGRFTARFTTGVANSIQRAGFVNLGVEVVFGYNGATFGILHRYGGGAEIRKLTIDTAASGNETLTITLNGTAYNVSVTSGTVQHNAAEIESSASTFTGWGVYANNDEVLFTAQSVDAKSGTYSISSTGTCDGTFSQIRAGASVTDDHVAQSDWNVDKMDGTGPSGMTLDPTTFNVFQIKYKYLAGGDIAFWVLKDTTGALQLVHRIIWQNNNTIPNMQIPNLKIGWLAASLGSTTDLSVYGASAMSATEGKIQRVRNPWGHPATLSSIGTNLTPVLAIRNRRVFNDVINLLEVLMLSATVGVDGTKPADIEIILNPSLDTGEYAWQYENETHCLVEYSTFTNSDRVSQGANSQEIYSRQLSKTDSALIDLEKFNVRLVPTDVLVIAVKATSGTTDSAVSFNWYDD